MKEVYEGAFVTLAATASRDSSFGCFRQSELKATPFAMVKTVVEKKVQLSVIRTWGHPWTLFGDVVNAIEYPLLSRAWVFQERLLSARVLHFTNNELMWECKSMVACECSGAGKDADEGNGAWRGIKHPFPKSENAQPIAPVTPMEAMVAQLRLNDHKVRCEGPWALEFSSEWCITLSRWCELISHYSRLQLTRESDRLPAISGIAKSLPTAEYGQYLAGLWQFELPYSLCWRTMEPSKPRRNDSLPTWSWISINGPVEGFFIRGYSAVTCFVTVKEVKCDIIGQDPFGEVEKGKLELEGVLIKGICSDKKGLQNRGKELRALNYFHNRAVEFEGITHICCWDGEPSEIGEELWFLKVASNAKIDFYLVLQRLGKHGRTYRRVGLVEDLTITRQANQNAQGIASSASLLSGSTLAASSSNTSSMRSSSKSPSRLDVRRLLGHARRKSAESIDESGGVAKRITIV